MEKSSLTPSHVAIFLGFSLDTRVGLAYPSERRIERWLSISEDLLAGQAQPALLWLRLLGHLAFLEKLVPYGRLRIRPIQFQLRSGWSQTRDHPLIQVNLDQGTRDSFLWWRTHSSLHKGIPLVSPLIKVFPLHRLKCCGLGCSHGQKDHLSEVVRGHEELHINVLELNAIWLGLQAFEDTLHDSNVAILCDNVSDIAYLRNQGGHSVSTDVPHGHRYLRMGRRTGHNTDTQTSSWASHCVSRSSEPQRSDSENRMESESSRSTSNLHVSETEVWKVV